MLEESISLYFFAPAPGQVCVFIVTSYKNTEVITIVKFFSSQRVLLWDTGPLLIYHLVRVGANLNFSCFFFFPDFLAVTFSFLFFSTFSWEQAQRLSCQCAAAVWWIKLLSFAFSCTTRRRAEKLRFKVWFSFLICTKCT